MRWALLGLLLLSASGEDLADDEGECFSAMQMGAPHAGIAAKSAGGEPPNVEGAGGRKAEEGVGVPKDSAGKPGAGFGGMAVHFQVMYSKLAELEARVGQLETANEEKDRLLEAQAARLAEHAALLQTGAAPAEEAQPLRRASGEERAAALQRREHQALDGLLRDVQAGGKRNGPLWISCADPTWNVSMGENGVMLDLGVYSCDMTYDFWPIGSGNVSLLHLDLNYGQQDFPHWINAMHIFEKIGKEVRKLIPKPFVSGIFGDLCGSVVGFLEEPSSGPALVVMDDKRSSVHVYNKDFKAFSTLATYGRQELAGMGVQAGVDLWKTHHCYNLTHNFNLPFSVAAGAGVVFDILPPAVTTNFWACFADFVQILAGQSTVAVFGLDLLAFGHTVLQLEVPVEMQIGNFSCSAGANTTAPPNISDPPNASLLDSGSRSTAPVQKLSVRMSEISLDAQSRALSKLRSLEGREAASVFGQAMRRPSSESLVEADAVAEAKVRAQQLFEMHMGDSELRRRDVNLTIADAEDVGLSQRGFVSGGKFLVGVHMHVGELLNFDEEFELLDFADLIRSGMSLVG